jgi:tetratricopeptide (TPR) repeat protein
MTPNTSPAYTPKQCGLLAYNARILVGNTYWLIVAPIAATQIVLFWSMATAVLASAARATQTIELLAPILSAFLCAHALASEEDGAGELVFVRPVSIEKVLLLRLCIIFAFVLAVLCPAFAVFIAKAPAFSPGLTLLAAVPSALCLSVLAMTVATVLRNAMLGFAAASAFWALDVLVGGYFNPLVTLHGYAGFLAGREMSELWKLNKLVLLVIAGLLYLWHRRVLTRPPAARRWTAGIRAGTIVVLVLVAYVASGAVHKVTYGMRHERELKHRTRMWYQQQFRGYGPIPVAWMFGPAFVRYVQAELGRDAPLAGRGEAGLLTRVSIASMQHIVDQYPGSAWADNAQFEIASHAGRQQLRDPWTVLAYRQNGDMPTTITISGDVESAAREYEVLAERYPDSPLAPVALQERAAIGLRLLDFEGTRAAYERLVADFPDAPESFSAGLQLAPVLLRGGAPLGALRAADVAAKVAPWDRRVEALILAARAANQAGDHEAAQDRYRRALNAARDAVERATRGDKTPSRIPKASLFATNNAIMTEAESALAGRMVPPTATPDEVSVVGRVVVEDDSAHPVRVAVGSATGPEGLPSPFREGPAASAAVDADGRFALTLPAGRYGVIACALRATDGARDLQIAGPPLPVEVDQTQNELLAFTVAVRPSKDLASPPPPAARSTRHMSDRRPARRGSRRSAGSGRPRSRLP